MSNAMVRLTDAGILAVVRAPDEESALRNPAADTNSASARRNRHWRDQRHRNVRLQHRGRSSEEAGRRRTQSCRILGHHPPLRKRRPNNAAYYRPGAHPGAIVAPCPRIGPRANRIAKRYMRSI